MLSNQQIEKTTSNFRRLLLFSGIFNIVLAAPLILPGIFAWYIRILGELNALLNLGGTMPVPPTEGIGALLANTAGIDLVLIGVIVIYASRKPLKRKGIALLNACGRTLFAFIVGYYCFAQDVARIILVIGIIDLSISVGFICYYLKIRGWDQSAS